MIKAVKKGKFKEILIYTKKVEIKQWTTLKEKWVIDEEGTDKGLKEKHLNIFYFGNVYSKFYIFLRQIILLVLGDEVDFLGIAAVASWLGTRRG